MPNPVDPAARDKYLLEVTAGPSYDPATHTQVLVNTPTPTLISSALLTARLHVRIKDYHGLPATSPSTSPYFQHDAHTSDRYSISYSFTPKRNISGQNLVMGFDYDHSIKHQLPPGTKTALKIVTSLLDPGLYSDPYCEEPYLYGPALSSWFAFSIGDRTADLPADTQCARLPHASDTGGLITEGGTGSGTSLRAAAHIPTAWKKRRKHFLAPAARSSFLFEQDRLYHADFFNPHLDFANFSLRLPGFAISVARYVDERTHHLRYVVRDRESGEVGLVVFFKLLFGDELEARMGEMEGEGEEEEEEKEQEKSAQEDTKNPHKEPSPLDYNNAILPRESQPPHPATPTPPHPHPAQEPPNAQQAERAPQNSSLMASAASASSTLATSIYGFYAALGFATSSSSSGDSDSDEKSTTRPPAPSLSAEIDNMDDETVERYLQARQSNLK